MLPRKRKPEPERYSIDDDAPDDLAVEIRGEFQSQRKAVYPHASPIGAKYDKVFKQAADRCRNEGMRAGEYVRLAIQECLHRGLPLYPQCLLVRLYQSSTEASRDKLNTYKAMLATFEESVRIYGPRMILADPTAHLSPLIRYSLARRYGFTDLADKNANEALAELNTLGSLVFDLFQDEAKALHGV